MGSLLEFCSDSLASKNQLKHPKDNVKYLTDNSDRISNSAKIDLTLTCSKHLEGDAFFYNWRMNIISSCKKFAQKLKNFIVKEQKLELKRTLEEHEGILLLVYLNLEEYLYPTT